MDRRQEMIDETSAFITWALDNPNKVPRVPVRPVTEGGFENLNQSRAARTVVAAWWSRAVSVVNALRW